MGFDLGNCIVMNAMSVYGWYCLSRYKRIAKKADVFGEEQLLGIMKRNKDTEIGVKLGFKDIHSIREYQQKIPFTTYEDYVPYIERMAKTGEQQLVTSDNVTFFAMTSGTTGVTKRIPVVNRSFKPVFRASAMIYHQIKQSMNEMGTVYGKGLNSLESVCAYTEGGIREGYISSFVMSSAGFVIPFITCVPKEVFGTTGADMKYIKARYALADRDLVYLMSVFMSTVTDLIKYISENRDLIIRDIRNGTIDPSVVMPEELRAKLQKKLKPDPKRADELEEAIDFNRPEGIIRRIWKKLNVVVAIGSGEFETFSRRMRVYCGHEVHFCNEMYASSEAILASSIRLDDTDYFMIPDAGLFEFIPVDGDFDEEKDVPLLFHELEVGKHYEVVVTNLAGLYRYRIKDVIKVVGREGKIPLVNFAYRKAQMINITGVKLTSEHMVSVMRALSSRIGVNVIDYSVYPDVESEPWRINVFIEFEDEIPDSIALDMLFDDELAKVNEEHGQMLRIGETSPSIVYVMHRNAYRELRDENAKKKSTDSQVKTIRYINSKAMLEEFMTKVQKVFGKEA